MPYSLMTIFKSLLSITLASLCTWTFGQPVTILKGSAPSFAGMETGLEIWADPISRTQEVKATATIDDQGIFELRLSHQDTVMGILSMRRFSAPFYLTPGSTYHVVIGDENEPPLVRTWQKGDLEYAISEIYDAAGHAAMREDLNALIAQIDQAYYQFFADHGELIGTRAIPALINSFEEEQSKGYPPDSYAARYVRYSAGEMRLACGLPRKGLYDALLSDAPLMLNHSGWFAFFDLFYENYFQNFSNRFGGEEIYNLINEGHSFHYLDSLFQKDDFAKRSDLRHTAMLQSISQSYFNNRYNRAALTLLLDEMCLSDAISMHLKQVALRLKERLGRTGLGASYHSLELIIPLEEGMPTLLFIAAPWSTAAQKEGLALQTLNEKYGAYFNIIEIWVESPESQHLNESKSWPVTIPKDVAAFMERMGVYRIPQFAWINEEGVIAANNMSPPSDRLERVLFKLKVEAEKANQIKVGQ